MRDRTSRNQANGSTVFRLHISMKLSNTAAVLPPLSLPKNVQFLLDQLLKYYKKPEDILGEQGLLKRFSKAVLERALGAELTEHLGYEKHDPAGYGSGNARNGTTEKTLKGKSGEITIEAPRDRKGTFEPQIVKKHQSRFDGFDSKSLSM